MHFKKWSVFLAYPVFIFINIYHSIMSSFIRTICISFNELWLNTHDLISNAAVVEFVMNECSPAPGSEISGYACSLMGISQPLQIFQFQMLVY